jgi:hypothetical protein
LRIPGALLVVLALAACTTQNNPAPGPLPTSPAQSAAADLRTHLDLLLGEQVMIVAKESAAAVNHSDEYSAYTSLLATNSADVTTLMGRAFGNTAAVEFAALWNGQNGFLVDYAIGVVTHNDDKSRGALSNLTSSFTPQFAQLVTTLSGLPADPVAQLVSQQVVEDQAFIDDESAGSYRSYYADLHRAYAFTSRLGDLLATQMAAKYPDKFPGDPAAQAVDRRAMVNLNLQEHAYLSTMATDAAIAKRDVERTEAVTALIGNTEAMGQLVTDQRFMLAWSQSNAALMTYASVGDAASRNALTNTFTAQLAAVSKTSSTVIAHQVDETVKVIDDQRAASDSVAGDDRAAATAMEPIADSAQS